MYYTARDGDNYMKFQLHRVKLDGMGDERLTDPAFMHTISLAPDDIAGAQALYGAAPPPVCTFTLSSTSATFGVGSGTGTVIVKSGAWMIGAPADLRRLTS